MRQQADVGDSKPFFNPTTKGNFSYSVSFRSPFLCSFLTLWPSAHNPPFGIQAEAGIKTLNRDDAVNLLFMENLKDLQLNIVFITMTPP